MARLANNNTAIVFIFALFLTLVSAAILASFIKISEPASHPSASIPSSTSSRNKSASLPSSRNPSSPFISSRNNSASPPYATNRSSHTSPPSEMQINQSSPSQPSSQPPSNSSYGYNLTLVCSITPNPEACETRLSEIHKPPKGDTIHIFTLCLEFSFQELKKVSTTFKPMFQDRSTEFAWNSCLKLFNDSMGKISDCLKEIRGSGSLSKLKKKAMASSIEDALGNEDACLNGLIEMGYSSIDDVEETLEKYESHMIISLAILKKLDFLENSFKSILKFL